MAEWREDEGWGEEQGMWRMQELQRRGGEMEEDKTRTKRTDQRKTRKEGQKEGKIDGPCNPLPHTQLSWA